MFRSSELIVTGDFNFHVHDSGSSQEENFLSFMESFDLVQGVRKPTHAAGHVLDLEFTRTASRVVNDIVVEDPLPTLLDHKVIRRSLSFHKPCTTRKTINFRRLGTIDKSCLDHDIQLSEVFTDPQLWLTRLDVLLNWFKINLFDRHAPLKSKYISFHQNAPWFNGNLLNHKRDNRRLERQFCGTRLEVDKVNI